MAADDSPRSSISDEQNQNPNPKINDNEDLEEGEILSENDSSNNIPKEIATKHLLENSWTFWYDHTCWYDHPSTKSKQAAWGSKIRRIYTFSSIEDFWGLYNNVHHPSMLTTGADFHCFKEKIEPKWEDPICSNGGKWTMIFPKGKSDTSWLYTLLAMIGEQFDHGDEICGAVVNVRVRQEKIAVWTKNAAKKAAQISIAEQWKKFLDYKDNVGYITHEHAIVYDRSAKDIYSA